MAKSSVEAYGAKSEFKGLYFDPEDIKLVTDPKHPLFDKRAVKPIDAAFVANLKKYGVLEPVIVWKDNDTGDVFAVAGRRRVLGAREANKQIKKEGGEPWRIPAIPKQGDASKLMAMMVIENEIREADRPTEVADKLARWMELGNSEEEAAVLIGKSVSTVKNYLRLRECTSRVRNAFDSGKIKVTVLYELAKLHPAEQNARLDQILADTGESDASDEAPESGAKPKKRTKNGKKARATASGVTPMRGKRELTKAIKEIDEGGWRDFTPNSRKVIAATINWVLGDDKALDEFAS